MVEDGHATLGDLRRLGSSEVVIEAVGLLTRRANDAYFKYIARLAAATGVAGMIARCVKRADLKNNLERNGGPGESLAKRYRKAQAMLAKAESLPRVAAGERRRNEDPGQRWKKIQVDFFTLGASSTAPARKGTKRFLLQLALHG